MRILLVALFMVLSTHVSGQELAQPALESQPVATHGQKKGAPTNKEDAATKQHSPADPSSALNGIESAIRDLIAASNKPESERDKDREIRDLDAQESMAFWAKLMFWATVATVGAAVVGVIYVRRTLHETRNIGQAQVRAYLVLEGDFYESVSGFASIGLTVRNVGNSPAKKCVISYSVGAEIFDTAGGKTRLVPRKLLTELAAVEVADIQTQGRRNVTLYLDQDTFIGDGWDEIRAHIDNGRWFTLHTTIVWTDVFGEPDTASTSFRSKFTNDEWHEEGGFNVVTGTLSEA